MKPIVSICPTDYPGTTSVLKHYNVTGLIEHTDEISKNTIEGREFAIFGGWHHIYYEGMKKVNSAGVPIGLFWTSSVGQIDFSHEGQEIAYLHLIKDLVFAGLIDKVFVATVSIQNMFQQMIDPEKVILLPYAYDWKEIQKHRHETEPGGDWIDFFCPASTRKNVVTHIHGAKIAGAHLHLSSMKPRYRFFADLINLKYTDMGWMSHPNYYKAVQTMKLGLQVTYAESFDYVVAEHFGLKRPCLISPVMGSWVDESLWDDLMVYNIDDPYEIAEKISKILGLSKRKYKSLNNRCYKFMKKEAERRNKMANETLTKILEELK